MDLRVIISCHKTNSQIFKKLLMSIGHCNRTSLKLPTLTEWSLPSMTLLRFQKPLFQFLQYSHLTFNTLMSNRENEEDTRKII